MSVPREPLYCTKCGTQLIGHPKHIGYESETGWKKFHIKFVCPNRKHIFDGHTNDWLVTYGVDYQYRTEINSVEMRRRFGIEEEDD